MKRLMEFLDDIGVAEGCKRQIFLLFPPIIFYDIEKDVRPRLQAILKVSAYSLIFDLISFPFCTCLQLMCKFDDSVIT